MCQTRRARINLIHPNALTWNLWLSWIGYQRGAGETKDTPTHCRWVQHTYISHVPASSSIIRRHGRVRFAVAVSTGDRMVLSHFLPANHAITRLPRPDPPGHLIRSSLVRLPLPLPNFRLQRLPVGGFGASRIAAVTSGWSGPNEVVMETHDRVSTLGHTPDSMADNLPFSSPSYSRQGRRPSRSRISQRPPRMGGWESSQYGGKPHGSPLYVVKGPSTLRVSLILLHTMHMGLVMCIGVREHIRATQFSNLVILFVIDAGCMYCVHTRGLNSGYIRRCTRSKCNLKKRDSQHD